jgi:hypothetical protein
MNIALIRLKGVVREMSRIASACERIASCWEAELAEKGHYMSPPKADLSGPEPELTYTDEEADALAEIEAQLKGSKRPSTTDEED